MNKIILLFTFILLAGFSFGQTAPIKKKNYVDEQKILPVESATPRTDYIAGPYRKTDGNWYEKDEAGVERLIIDTVRMIPTQYYVNSRFEKIRFVATPDDLEGLIDLALGSSAIVESTNAIYKIEATNTTGVSSGGFLVRSVGSNFAILDDSKTILASQIGMTANDNSDDTEALENYNTFCSNRTNRLNIDFGRDTFNLLLANINNLESVFFTGDNYVLKLPQGSYKNDTTQMMIIDSVENIVIQNGSFEGGLDEEGYTWIATTESGKTGSYLLDIYSPIDSLSSGEVIIRNCDFNNSLLTSVNIFQDASSNEYKNGYQRSEVINCDFVDVEGAVRMYGNFTNQRFIGNYFKQTKYQYPASQSSGGKSFSALTNAGRDNPINNVYMDGNTIEGGTGTLFPSNSAKSILINNTTVIGLNTYTRKDGSKIYFQNQVASLVDTVSASTGFALKVDLVKFKNTPISISNFIQKNTFHGNSYSGETFTGSIWLAEGTTNANLSNIIVDANLDTNESESGTDSESRGAIINNLTYNNSEYEQFSLSDVTVSGFNFVDTIPLNGTTSNGQKQSRYFETGESSFKNNGVDINNNVTLNGATFYNLGFSIGGSGNILKNIRLIGSSGIQLPRDTSDPYDKIYNNQITGVNGGGIKFAFRSNDREDGTGDINNRLYLENIRSEFFDNTTNTDKTFLKTMLLSNYKNVTDVFNTFDLEANGNYSVNLTGVETKFPDKDSRYADGGLIESESNIRYLITSDSTGNKYAVNKSEFATVGNFATLIDLYNDTLEIVEAATPQAAQTASTSAVGEEFWFRITGETGLTKMRKE